MKALRIMLEKDLTHQIMEFRDRYQKVKIKKIGLMKNELGRKITTEFAGLRPNTSSYLINSGNEDKEAKGTKKCVIKRRLKLEDYKKCLQNNKTTLRSQQRFKSEVHNVFTEKVNKTALRSMSLWWKCGESMQNRTAAIFKYQNRK